MIVALRLLALVGSLASAVDRLIGSLLGFLPFRVPGALLVAVLLGLAAAGCGAIASSTPPIPS